MPVLGHSAADPWGTLPLMTDPAANAARGAPGTPTARALGAAELLSIGTELTVGETRDTNAGEIARDLTQLGVRIGRLTAVPDRLDVVRDAFATGLDRADLVISTGGLGPTPDDLTREAIAAAVGETPSVDPALEEWLRGLWIRRGIEFPTMNLKQAWLLPSATPIPNPNGTAPGWWVDAPEGRVIVALPGPPREMRPMWRDWVMPRLTARGLGRDHVIRTYRLTGIGESAVADMLGETLLRRENPEVATYARVEAVDVRISAFGEPRVDGRPAQSAEALVASAELEVLALLGGYVWGRGDETWSDAIARRLTARGWTLSTLEVATGGSLMTLLGDHAWLQFGQVVGEPAAAVGPAWMDGIAAIVAGTGSEPSVDEARMIELARDVAATGGTQVGVAVVARAAGADTEVLIGVAAPEREAGERRLAFLGGSQGRARAALNAAAALWRALPEEQSA